MSEEARADASQLFREAWRRAKRWLAELDALGVDPDVLDMLSGSIGHVFGHAAERMGETPLRKLLTSVKRSDLRGLDRADFFEAFLQALDLLELEHVRELEYSVVEHMPGFDAIYDAIRMLVALMEDPEEGEGDEREIERVARTMVRLMEV